MQNEVKHGSAILWLPNILILHTLLVILSNASKLKLCVWLTTLSSHLKPNQINVGTRQRQSARGNFFTL